MKIFNNMNLIHDNEVNLISDYNLLYDILNTSKYTKIKNKHYSHILNRCMNTREGKSRFKKFYGSY